MQTNGCHDERAKDPFSHLSGIEGDQLRLDRSLPKDRAAEILRDSIRTGRIPEGTKLTERKVSRLLGISHMPAHEALTTLEADNPHLRSSLAQSLRTFQAPRISEGEI